MPSILRYPSKVQNIEGNNIPYRSCDHIENITNDLNTVGHWGYADPGAKYKNAIAGRNGSRKHPSTIRGYDFKYDGLIPDSAKVKVINLVSAVGIHTGLGCLALQVFNEMKD